MTICTASRISYATLAFALLTAAAPAFASAEPDAVADESPRDTIIVTGQREGYAVKRTRATKIDADLKDIPQSINVVPEDVLRDQRALSVEDALKNIPGVGFSHGDGQRDQVSIRGFTAIADQFVDGLRDDALYFRDLSNVERIEVLKGPASVLYGRGSSGGLVNRVTKKPGRNVAEMAVSYGKADDARGEFDVGMASDKAAYRLTGAIERADSYRQQQFLERETIAPSVLFSLGDRTRVMVQADYLRDKRVTDFGIPAYQGRPAAVPRETYYGSANARRDDTSQSTVWSGTLTLDHDFSETTRLHNALRYYDYELDRRNTLVSGLTGTAVTLNRSMINRHDRGWFNQLELVHTAQLPGMEHKLLIGVEVGQQIKDALTAGIDPKQAPVVDLFKPVLPSVLPALTLNGDSRGTFNTLGVYAQDLMSLGDHWKALIGVRFDRFGQRTDDRFGNWSIARTDKTWSPRAGLVWQPDAAQSYYLSWSKSFQPSGEAFNIAKSNADIAPEETTNLEAGAKYALWQGRLNLTLSAFQLERTGIKGSNPATPLKIETIGTQRTRGVEATATANLGSGWSAIAGYAYLDAKVTASATPALLGKYASITPEHAANLWLAKDIDGTFGFGAGANYVGDRFADPANTVVLPGYVTADAMAWAQIGALRAQLNATNLFNKDYIVSAHGFSPNLLLPGAPRQLMLTLRYNFLR